MADKRYLVLARKWRPQRFEDVVGQEHITRTLRNAISTGRIHHAFLFIGSRGIGKTTTARILAKALNCLNAEAPTPEPCGECDNCTSISGGANIDVIEIDGASNNGVDDVREIRDNIRMVPTNSRFKVYIIDEVHQLTLPAFNALLKTLEEPPPHAIFVLATTESHKIPATIVSRCQRYDFRRVAIPEIVRLLRSILEAEGMKASDEALHAIAQAAEGGVRDAESILDELITYCEGEIAFQDVFDVLGLVDWRVLHELCEAILAQDVARLLALVDQVVAAGKDLSQFVQDILRYFRNLLVCKTAGDTSLLQLPEEEAQEMHARAEQFALTQLIRLVEAFAELTSGFDSQLAQRIALEALLIRVSKVGVDLSVDTVLEKLMALGQGGALAAAPGEGGAAPPDPPRAGPAEPAPTAPAPKKRAPLTVTADNLSKAWKSVARRIQEDSRISLGVLLGNAKPIAVEDDILVIELPADMGRERDDLNDPAMRAMLEEDIQACCANLRAFRVQLAENAADAPAAAHEAPPGPTGEPFYPSANPEDARAALADPGIARVVDVFKGRIVEVRHPDGPGAPA